MGTFSNKLEIDIFIYGNALLSTFISDSLVFYFRFGNDETRLWIECRNSHIYFYWINPFDIETVVFEIQSSSSWSSSIPGSSPESIKVEVTREFHPQSKHTRCDGIFQTNVIGAIVSSHCTRLHSEVPGENIPIIGAFGNSMRENDVHYVGHLLPVAASRVKTVLLHKMRLSFVRVRSGEVEKRVSPGCDFWKSLGFHEPYSKRSKKRKKLILSPIQQKWNYWQLMDANLADRHAAE